MSDTPEREHRPQRIRSRAMVLVVLGVLLLTPPLASIFQSETKIFDIPVTLIYLFLVWALLIAGAAALAKPLQSVAEDEDQS